jgi:hypothetical protein
MEFMLIHRAGSAEKPFLRSVEKNVLLSEFIERVYNFLFLVRKCVQPVEINVLDTDIEDIKTL